MIWYWHFFKKDYNKVISKCLVLLISSGPWVNWYWLKLFECELTIWDLTHISYKNWKLLFFQLQAQRSSNHLAVILCYPRVSKEKKVKTPFFSRGQSGAHFCSMFSFIFLFLVFIWVISFSFVFQSSKCVGVFWS